MLILPPWTQGTILPHAHRCCKPIILNSIVWSQEMRMRKKKGQKRAIGFYYIFLKSDMQTKKSRGKIGLVMCRSRCFWGKFGGKWCMVCLIFSDKVGVRWLSQVVHSRAWWNMPSACNTRLDGGCDRWCHHDTDISIHATVSPVPSCLIACSSR